MLNTFLQAFIPLFVAFDVLGLLPVYFKYTALMDPKTRDRHLRDSLFTSSLTTLAFVIVGNRIMSYLGISINDFLVAGGIVIFITAIKEIINRPEEAEKVNDMFGVVPLGIPLLAGPAVLATSIIIWNTYQYYYFLISLLLNILVCGFVLKFSGTLMKIMGRRLIEALSRVFSLVIASIAVMFIRRGIQGM
ncbi:MAG TPA: MarC family protein [Syntrophorhabdaceae bacterium]|nr:MarC family protein [Syntrophorhabdaceae bacterium]